VDVILVRTGSVHEAESSFTVRTRNWSYLCY